MDFSRVLRTWFYNDDILGWYADFNRVRTAFFKDHGVFDGLVPASTGIGARNPFGAALTASLIAVKPKNTDVKSFAVPSPLQCPALEYGSSFSRAVEYTAPDHRRLWISGTASIEPGGATVHLGDVVGQVKLTMEVVEAILTSRNMSWTDVSRGLAYARYADQAGAFSDYCRTRPLPDFPVMLTNNVVCRDDLLFEIEVDAMQARSPDQH